MLDSVLRPFVSYIPESNRLERIWVMAKTDFLQRYYGSALGLVWALINPLFQLFVYYFVFTVIFNSTIPLFALFLFLGLIFWMFFAEASSVGLNILRQKSYLLMNIRMNWLDIYFASILSTFFAFVFNFSVYLVVSLFFPIDITWGALIIPVLVINLVVFILGVQLILSVINIFLRDIVHFWDMLSLLLLWVSGIFFSFQTLGDKFIFQVLMYLTPLPGILINARNTLIYGQPVDWILFIYCLTYALVLILIAILFFRINAHKALEKL